ncbi:MAG: TAT-variant-translocated molybdopterin oxidoreductase, partial [Rhodothermales bacterium]|nr:TAT-variant-translocated molybdopterin oxidoreductase [Rhodothermales bacterium]
MIDLPILGDAPSGDGSSRPASHAAPAYWRSSQQLRRPDEVAAVHGEEFMPEAVEAPSHANRRQFLQLAGAGVAMAGLTGCRRPVEQILPYTRKPQDVIEGLAQYYATSMPFRGTAYPVLAKSHVGRPTKLEGNPDHPYGVGGGSSAVVQAAILGLYDPDRSRRIVAPASTDATWQSFVSTASALSGPLAVLAEPSSSPTVARLRTALAARFPGLRWVTYRPEGDGGFAEATRTAYGRALRPIYDFAQADVIVSFDADFLGGADVNQAANARSFAQGRRPENDRMSRFYAVESTYTVTGGQADHRLRLKPSQVAAFAQALAARTGAYGAASGTADDRTARFFDALVADLAGKRAVFVAGETMPAAVHGLALALTAQAGGLGTALRLVDANETEAEPQATTFANLVRDMKAGQVPTLLMIGVNPAYDAPASYGFADALKAVRTSIHVGQHRDETAALATWHLPRTHFLEAWGDARAYDGTLAVVQPLIAPLNDTEAVDNRRIERDDLHSEVEILNVLANRTDVSGYELVRETWRGQIQGDFETGWTKIVHDGYAPGTAYAAATAGAPATVPAMPAAPQGGVEIAFRLDPTMVDGSIANNGWLIEFPDNVTKLVWDN